MSDGGRGRCGGADGDRKSDLGECVFAHQAANLRTSSASLGAGNSSGHLLCNLNMNKLNFYSVQSSNETNLKLRAKCNIPPYEISYYSRFAAGGTLR